VKRHRSGSARTLAEIKTVLKPKFWQRGYSREQEATKKMSKTNGKGIDGENVTKYSPIEFGGEVNEKHW